MHSLSLPLLAWLLSFDFLRVRTFSKSVFPQGPLPLFRRAFGKSCVGLFVGLGWVSNMAGQPVEAQMAFTRPAGIVVGHRELLGYHCVNPLTFI